MDPFAPSISSQPLGCKEIELTRYCAYCFEITSLTRCSGCKLAYYCSQQCQKSDWAYHGVFCKNEELKTDWINKLAILCWESLHSKRKPSYGLVEGLQKLSQTETTKPSANDRLNAIQDLELLEYWSKRVLISSGYLKLLLENVRLEQSEEVFNEYNVPSVSYNYSLVAVIDVLRAVDQKDIDETICIASIYDYDTLSYILSGLSSPHLSADQLVSALRLLRLLCANSQTQELIIDRISTTVEQLQAIIEIMKSPQVVSEIGCALTSLLYSQRLDANSLLQLRNSIGKTLDVKSIIECAFGESPWSATDPGQVEMGAVELVLALLDGNPLTPSIPESERLPGTFVTEYLLDPGGIPLLRDCVYGFMDLLWSPKLYGAALFGLASLFANPAVVKFAISNGWLITTPEEIEEEAALDEFANKKPLEIVLQLAHQSPHFSLTYFDTNIHHNILSIVYNIISSKYCTSTFLEEAMGIQNAREGIDFLDRSYEAAVKEAKQRQKLAKTTSLFLTPRDPNLTIDNTEELVTMHDMISDVKHLLDRTSFQT